MHYDITTFDANSISPQKAIEGQECTTNIPINVELSYDRTTTPKHLWSCHDSFKTCGCFTISGDGEIDILNHQDEIYVCPRICQEFAQVFFIVANQLLRLAK